MRTHGIAAKAVRTILWAGGFAMVLAALSTDALAQPRVPEIDPGSMSGALALLTGGLLMLSGRRRRR